MEDSQRGRPSAGAKLQLLNPSHPAPPTFSEMAAFAARARAAATPKPASRTPAWWKLAR